MTRSGRAAFTAGIFFALGAAFATVSPVPASPGARATLSAIVANDNTHAAGNVSGGALHLAIVARNGLWYPDGPGTMGLPIEAFGEAGKPLRIPGPLVRVPLGTRVVASVRNELAHDLTVRGLASPANALTTALRVPRGATKTVSFVLDQAGTFGYYGSDKGETIDARVKGDAELSGAIVVDAPHVRPVDHVFVLGLYSPIAFENGSPNFLYLLETINGRAFPATERLAYARGAHVRWGVYNASSMTHPMHLHGFYFHTARPDAYDEVTHAFEPGDSEEIAWTADRAGDWMWHCHIGDHTSQHASLADMRGHKADPALTVTKRFHLPNVPMGGMVIAVHVTPRAGDAAPVAARDPRELALDVTQNPDAKKRFGLDDFSYTLTEGATTIPHTGTMGPPIVLEQGRPVAIAVTNHLKESTSVHWHGIRLQDSYYDGGAGMGMSMAGSRMPPAIGPGGTFTAQFVPPDAGTFVYHAHLDDDWQISSGLVGPLIVMPRGQSFDPASDHIVLISESAETPGGPTLAIDGMLEPAPMAVTAGVAQRLRLSDFTLGGENLVVSLSDGKRVLDWTPISKDGRDVPLRLQRPGHATHGLTIGETRDFRFTPMQPGTLLLEVYDRNLNNAIVATQRIDVTVP